MNKKVNVLVGLTFLFILVMGVAVSYSKYISGASANATAPIAKFNISVNDCDIVNPDKNNNLCFKETINPDNTITLNRNFGIKDIAFNTNGNTNVVDNKIAPGSSGEFKIRIKPNDTGVSVKYKLNVSLDENNKFIKLYRSDPNKNNRIPVDANGYEGLILYNANNVNYEEVITIYVVWENDDTGANDIVDTEIGTSNSTPTLSIPISIVFEQYKG